MAIPVTRRRYYVDYTLLAVVLCLATFGLVALQSAATGAANWHLTQAGWMVFGCAAAILVTIVDYRHYQRLAYLFYGGVSLLLVLVLFVGISRNNATRWLDLGVFEAQPSELAKLAVVLITARFLQEKQWVGGLRLRDLVIPFVLTMTTVILVAAEPDLGTALVILAIFLTMVLFDGLRRSSLIILLVSLVLLALPVWQFGLESYQRERITAFLNPEGLHQESAWQVRQAIIAVASGGLAGKGHGQGSQVQSGFVPENENDFIFAHIGEEFGFLGCGLVLALYTILILWSLRIARYARDKFGVLLAVGIAALFFWHVVVNIGMVLGLLPVVGLWLPFISYGGSSVVTVMISVGLLINLSMRRHVFHS
ncbi:MAG: rod shape-determining protein RodA [Bradymonadales bacterium]|nr:rod shape-determining protein RodA [Bradymonadales bacterium]